jgi:hypothetical protein
MKQLPGSSRPVSPFKKKERGGAMFYFFLLFFNNLDVCILGVSTCSQYYVVEETTCNCYHLRIDILTLINK